MEYTKQLILSCLLNICQKLSPDGGRIPKGMCLVGGKGRKRPACAWVYQPLLPSTVDVVDEEKFNVELIVQCIRLSEMPQTHHHALLLLGTVAGIFPVSERYKTRVAVSGLFFNASVCRGLGLSGRAFAWQRLDLVWFPVLGKERKRKGSLS